jgi:hypothetical protein
MKHPKLSKAWVRLGGCLPMRGTFPEPNTFGLVVTGALIPLNKAETKITHWNRLAIQIQDAKLCSEAFSSVHPF